MEVIGDQGVEFALAFELALDSVGAGTLGGGAVDDTTHPVDPLAAEDPFAFCNATETAQLAGNRFYS
ncbi:MAG: hypothetical protein ACJ780_15740 [Solirubrobacteraceae bacterium]